MDFNCLIWYTKYLFCLSQTKFCSRETKRAETLYSCFSSFGDFYDLKVKIAVFSCLDENLVAGEQSKSIVALLVTRATILLSPC